MDREIRRRVEEYRHTEAGPIENNLIDELVGGDLDREEFLRRASVFGLGAGTTGLLLRYIGEDVAFGAPTAVAQKRGGTLRVGATKAGSSFEPILLREAGSLAFDSLTGEFLTFSNAAAASQAGPRDELEVERHATVWTFQLRRGVKFHNGKTFNADDVVASFKQYMAAATSELFSAIPKTLLAPEGVIKRGPYTVEFRLKSPSGAFPYLVSQTSYQAIIQPAAIASETGDVGLERDDRNGTVPVQERYAEHTRRARPLPGVLGRLPAARRRGVHVVRRHGAAGTRVAWGSDRPCCAALCPGGGTLQEQQSLQGLHRAVSGSPDVRLAGRPRSVQGPAGATRHRADAQPPGHDQEGPPRCGHARQRLAVLVEVPVHRPVDQAAQAEPRARASSAPGRRTGKTSSSRSPRGTGSTCPTMRRRSRPRDARRAWTSISRCSRTPSTTAAGPTTTRRRRGSTVPRRSRSTALAGCRTPTSRLRTCRTGSGMPRTTRTPSSTRRRKSYLAAPDIQGRSERPRRSWPASSCATRRSSRRTSSRSSPPVVEGSELPGRGDLARASREDVAQHSENGHGRPEIRSGRPTTRDLTLSPATS